MQIRQRKCGIILTSSTTLPLTHDVRQNRIVVDPEQDKRFVERVNMILWERYVNANRDNV